MRIIFAFAVVLLLGHISASADMLVVANNADNTISLIDTRSTQTLANIPVGAGPHEIAVSRDGRYAYVAESGSPEKHGDSIAVLDLKNRNFKARFKVQDCQMPHDLRVSRDGSLLWVACAPTQSVVELDAKSGGHRKTWKTGVEGGWMLEVSPDEKTLLVAHLEGGGVSFIDRRSGAVKFVPTTTGEMAFDATPDGKEVWAANSQSHKLTVIDSDQNKKLTEFALAGEAPVRLKFTSDGKLALISMGRARKLLLYDVQSRKLVGTIDLPASAKVTAVSKDGKRAYMSSPGSDRVMVVDVVKRKVLESIKVGRQPDGVAVVPR